MRYSVLMLKSMGQSLARLLFVCTSMFCLSGCISVLPESEPPAPRYTIASVDNALSGGQSVDWSLVIADPVSSQLYNTVKIALTRAPNKFEFYAGSEWADRAPVLLQQAIIRSFENTGRILQVGDYTALPVSDYVLNLDIREFHADYAAGSPMTKVTVFARLSTKKGEIIVGERFSTSYNADQDNLADIMSAFDRSLEQVIADLVRWSLLEADGHYDSTAAATLSASAP